MLPVRYRTTGGRARLSVTQVLSLAGRIHTGWYTPEAAERGEVVHSLTERFDRGDDSVWDRIPAEYVGYIEAYANFIGTVKPTWVAIETEVQSDTLDVAGRIDRVASNLFGTPGILDIKTGGPTPWHSQQLAAYNVLRPTGSRWTLHLTPMGRYQLRRHDDDSAYRQFFYDLGTAKAMVNAAGDQWIAR